MADTDQAAMLRVALASYALRTKSLGQRSSGAEGEAADVRLPHKAEAPPAASDVRLLT